MLRSRQSAHRHQSPGADTAAEPRLENRGLCLDKEEPILQTGFTGSPVAPHTARPFRFTRHSLLFDPEPLRTEGTFPVVIQRALGLLLIYSSPRMRAESCVTAVKSAVGIYFGPRAVVQFSQASVRSYCLNTAQSGIYPVSSCSAATSFCAQCFTVVICRSLSIIVL